MPLLWKTKRTGYLGEIRRVQKKSSNVRLGQKITCPSALILFLIRVVGMTNFYRTPFYGNTYWDFSVRYGTEDTMGDFEDK